MKLTIATPVMSKQSPAYTIKNPKETQNAHSVKSATDAACILHVSGADEINKLKDMIKELDFTSISTNELSKIGAKLYKMGLIDRGAVSFFIGGNRAFDADGQQTERDVKFNAIAQCNEMFNDTKQHGKDYPYVASQQGYQHALKSLLSANQAINALFYFANSAQRDLSVHERA